MNIAIAHFHQIQRFEPRLDHFARAQGSIRADFSSPELIITQTFEHSDDRTGFEILGLVPFMSAFVRDKCEPDQAENNDDDDAEDTKQDDLFLRSISVVWMQFALQTASGKSQNHVTDQRLFA